MEYLGLSLLFAGWLIFNWDDFFKPNKMSKLEQNMQDYEKKRERELSGIQRKAKTSKSGSQKKK